MTTAPLRRTLGRASQLLRATASKRQCQWRRNLGHVTQQRTLANISSTKELPLGLSFSHSPPCSRPDGLGSSADHKPPDERTLKLGKTVRILHDRLPTLLASPLPQDTLSPQITLRLFPSTHPHLPTVSGRLAYTAALWTSPVAWGRMPVVGNVKLVILSERMVRDGGMSWSSDSRTEKLIVRWKTCDKAKNVVSKTKDVVTDQVHKITDVLGAEKKDEQEDFVGLFIFEFDEQGRIISHTIEHVQEGGNWEKTAKVISVTDWMLGRAWGKKDEVPGLALDFGPPPDIQEHSNRRHSGNN